MSAFFRIAPPSSGPSAPCWRSNTTSGRPCGATRRLTACSRRRPRRCPTGRGRRRHHPLSNNHPRVPRGARTPFDRTRPIELDRSRPPGENTLPFCNTSGRFQWTVGAAGDLIMLPGEMTMRSESTPYVPPYYRSGENVPRRLVEPQQGSEYLYDENTQTATWLTNVQAGSGYHTNQGGDWVKTDEI